MGPNWDNASQNIWTRVIVEMTSDNFRWCNLIAFNKDNWHSVRRHTRDGYPFSLNTKKKEQILKSKIGN